jgi:hypothetical protein
MFTFDDQLALIISYDIGGALKFHHIKTGKNIVNYKVTSKESNRKNSKKLSFDNID